MVYFIHSKIQVTGKLAVVRSLHVGGFGTSTNVDLPLAVNGKGEVYIPGTSLAGALRSWMAKLCNPKQVEALWGYQPASGSQPAPNSPQEGHASRVMIEDAVATLPNGKAMTLQEMELRSGVGIDRNSGTAAVGCLYSRGVIPRGATLNFSLSVEVTHSEKEAGIKQAIDQLLLAMQHEEIRLGAAKSRGLGRVKLVDCKQPVVNSPEIAKTEGVQPLQVNNREGMLAFLNYRAHPVSYLQLLRPPATTLTLPSLSLTLTWHPVGPLMVKSELTGDAVDILPLMGSVNNQSAFLLSGASIKGALRTQGERIVRTVLDRPLEAAAAVKFANQIRLPLINTLFGLAADDVAVGKSKENDPDSPPDSQWSAGLSALWIEDCFSETEHPADTLQRLSRVAKEPATELQTVLKATKLTGEHSKGNVDTQLAYHVAVDRWTGGAADGFLYTNLEPFNLPWEPIELTIDFNRFPEEDDTRLAGVALLLLLLRDLGDRRIPLGYGTNRGLGTMTLSEVAFTVHGEVPEALKALGKTAWVAEGDRPLNFSTLDATVLNSLNAAWSTWIEQAATTANEEVSDHD